MFSLAPVTTHTQTAFVAPARRRARARARQASMNSGPVPRLVLACLSASCSKVIKIGAPRDASPLAWPSSVRVDDSIGHLGASARRPPPSGADIDRQVQHPPCATTERSTGSGIWSSMSWKRYTMS